MWTSQWPSGRLFVVVGATGTKGSPSLFRGGWPRRRGKTVSISLPLCILMVHIWTLWRLPFALVVSGQQGSPSVVGPTCTGSGGKLTPEARRRVDKWGGCLATSPKRCGLSEVHVGPVPDVGAALLQGKEPGRPGPRGQLPKLNKDPGVGRSSPPKGPAFPNSSLDPAGR